jgi:hypothetical protein
VCALIRVKLDEKCERKNWGTPPQKKLKIEKSELSKMARTLIGKLIFKKKLKFFTLEIFPNFFEIFLDFFFGGGVSICWRSKGGDLGFLRAQTREARTPLGVRQYIK